MGKDAVNIDWDIQPQFSRAERREKIRREGYRIHVDSAWIPATAIFSLVTSMLYLSSRIWNRNNTPDSRSNSPWTMLVVELLAASTIIYSKSIGPGS